MNGVIDSSQADQVRRRLERLYGQEHSVHELMRRFYALMGRYGVGLERPSPSPLWNENDTVLITYADTLNAPGEMPLQTLRRFLCRRLKNAIRTVHILPFYPWSSDDGFSVIDYRTVDSRSGDWRDVVNLGGEFDLMFDLVLNHCSRESDWFRQFVTGIAPARHYFLPTDPETDLSDVVRPRALPLLTKTSTRNGEAWVWTTFSEDQVDLNWKNPDVFFEFLDILFLYLSKRVRILRMDAVAFLWKEIGTSCLHLPETHEMVKLLRDVLEIVAPHVIIVTETNVPHEENISYFGDGDEAHMVYNFSLPPLLLHGLLRGDATHLSNWARTLPDLPAGQTFFNFTASHDGVGVRPLQGILEDSELDWLVDQVRAHGGRVSMRAMGDGTERPYELNITYVDALGDPDDEKAGRARFLCSQAVMLSMRGIPGIYIHSVLGTPNWQEGFQETGHNRTLNRRKWNLEELESILANPESSQHRIFEKMLLWLRRRQNHPAFHPDAPMEVLDTPSQVFAFLRTSLAGEEKIVCIFNFSGQTRSIRFADLHPSLGVEGTCRDILASTTLKTAPERTLSLDPWQARWLVCPHAG